MYYSPEPEKSPPWWAEVFVLIRAILGVLLWPMAALLGAIAALIGLVILFTIHWAFGVLFLACALATIGAFALWERRRPSPL